MKALEFDPRLERVRDPLIFALIAGPVGSFVAALLAVSLYAVSGARSVEQLPYDFMLWWFRDWLGVMVTAPLIFAWVYRKATPWTWPRIGEAIALLLSLFLGSQLMFGLWGVFATRDVPITFVFFPIVGWAGLRFGARGATTVVALIAALAIAVAGMGIGPFSAFPIGFIQFLLFSFLALGSLSGLLLAAIMAERDDALTKRLRPRRAVAPLAEDGGRRPARRRHRARLQQPADGDHRLHRDRADVARSERRAPRRRRRDRRAPRCAPPI